MGRALGGHTNVLVANAGVQMAFFLILSKERSNVTILLATSMPEPLALHMATKQMLQNTNDLPWPTLSDSEMQNSRGSASKLETRALCFRLTTSPIPQPPTSAREDCRHSMATGSQLVHGGHYTSWPALHHLTEREKEIQSGRVFAVPYGDKCIVMNSCILLHPLYHLSLSLSLHHFRYIIFK